MNPSSCGATLGRAVHAFRRPLRPPRDRAVPRPGTRGTSWSAPTTGGATGPGAPAPSFPSCRTRRGCRPVPAPSRTTCQERYGLVWVALEEPRFSLPEVPELDVPRGGSSRTGPFAWRSDASRQVENFTDFGHFAFVHRGLLGDPDQPVVAPHEVGSDGPELRYGYARPDSQHRRVPGLRGGREEGRDAPHALRPPSPVHHRRAYRLGRTRRHDLLFRVPAGLADRCIGYRLVARQLQSRPAGRASCRSSSA